MEQINRNIYSGYSQMIKTTNINNNGRHSKKQILQILNEVLIH